MKKSLLQRMGLRQRDLNWAGRELLELYCRSTAKLTAIDRWLETHELIDHRGEYPNVLKLYGQMLNTSVKTLGELRRVVETMAVEDDRFGRALEALAAEGARVRADR